MTGDNEGQVRDDEGQVGMMRDWTGDTGTQLGMRSHTPSIWTGAKLGERHHTAWEGLGLDRDHTV